MEPRRPIVVLLARSGHEPRQQGPEPMNNIFYIIGVIVVVLAVLSLLGLA
jgi:hypothetical protein